MSFQAGPSPWALAPPSLMFPVAATGAGLTPPRAVGVPARSSASAEAQQPAGATRAAPQPSPHLAARRPRLPPPAADAPQVFPLPADLPAGRYLRLNLHGKRQQQLEDMQARAPGSRGGPGAARAEAAPGRCPCRPPAQRRCLHNVCLPTRLHECPQWYHAIQRVEAFGRQLPPPAVASLRSWAAREALPAAAPGAVPAYLVAGMLEAEAERRASGQEQQQQQQQGRQRKVQQQQGQPAAMEPGGNGEQAAAARSAADGDSSSDGSPMQPG